jgi:hypothetical protein
MRQALARLLSSLDMWAGEEWIYVVRRWDARLHWRVQ